MIRLRIKWDYSRRRYFEHVDERLQLYTLYFSTCVYPYLHPFTFQPLHSVRSQHVSIRSDILRSLVVPLPPKPKKRHEYGHAAGQKARVIHRRRRDGHREWKAEDHDKDNDVQTSNSVDDEANSPFHPEPTWCYLGASAQQVR